MSSTRTAKMWVSLKGETVSAEYHPDPDFPEFSGIPSIEALPKVYETESDIRKVLEVLPQVDPQDLKLLPIKRLMKLSKARRFYIPVERAITLAIDFQDMLYWGLQERNPVDPRHIEKTHKGFNDSQEFEKRGDELSGTIPVGIVLMGFGGTGKTQTVNRILYHYPQCISHSFYNGKKLTFKQVVWLKLDCPEGGGRRGLFYAIFQQLDNLLRDTTYFIDCAKSGTASAEAMIPFVANVLQNHFVGVLVIDEFQNFYGSQEGELTLRFLRRLSNVIGIPLVLVGTPDASKTMIGQFSLMRRASAYGNHEWREMKRSSEDSVGDWDVFFAALSDYYYLEGKLDYDAVSASLHEVSGGIPDIGVKIWTTTQNRLLRAGKSNHIKADDIRRVAKTEFPWVADAIAALREGTAASYRRYGDLYFSHIKDDPKTGKTENPSEMLPAEKAESTEGNTPVPPAPKTLRRTMKTQQTQPATSEIAEPTILSIVAEGKKTQKSAYQSLLDAGFISSTDRFLS